VRVIGIESQRDGNTPKSNKIQAASSALIRNTMPTAGLELARDPTDALLFGQRGLQGSEFISVLSLGDGRPSTTPSAFARATPDRRRSRLTNN
jgi:hypothetical protein